MSHHDALLYTWGLASTDNWGLIRRDHVKALVFPYRSTDARVAAGLDHLVAAGKICEQRHNGHEYLHWCFFDEYQRDPLRKRQGSPPFTFTCHNDGQIRTGGSSGKSAEVGGKSPTQDKTIQHKTTTAQAAEVPAARPPSRLLQAVMARTPAAHAYYYEAFTNLEDEYGPDFMWDCYRAALESGNTDPSARYLESIARRCKAEGRNPLTKEDLKDGGETGTPELPDEIEGHKVVGWNSAAGLPIVDARPQAS